MRTEKQVVSTLATVAAGLA
ncbi:TPA: VENN motif pre-toxin domain-containing protein, partial [Escherichia coli]|nr:VENN motif pre-toxin domain-containing protein [Escherichia coli]HDW8456799.1 VENN motif pre-toxin domain-containing protein [Escherichia coli]